MPSFARVIVRGIVAKRSNRGRVYLERNYPRLYRAILGELSRGRCPFCGARLKGRKGLPGHLNSPRCRATWAEFFSRLAGRGRLSEDEAFDLLNRIRSFNGLEPLEPDSH